MITEKRLREIFNLYPTTPIKSYSKANIWLSYYVSVGYQLMNPIFKKIGKPKAQFYYYSGHPFLEQLRILMWNMAHSNGFYIPIKLSSPVTMISEHCYLFYCNNRLITNKKSNRFEVDVDHPSTALHDMYETYEECCNECDWINNKSKHNAAWLDAINVANQVAIHFDIIFWAVRMALDPPSYMPHHPKYERARIPTFLWV